MAKKPKSDGLVDIWLRRRGRSLVPVAELDLDVIMGFREDANIVCKLIQPRDDATNRWFHALCGKIGKALDRPTDSIKSQIMFGLKMIKGMEVLPDGSVYYERMHLDELGQEEFNEFIERAKIYITTELMPGCTIKEIMDGVYTYAGIVELEL